MAMSMAKLEDLVAETWVVVRELAESHKETERFLKESAAAADRRSAELSAEADKRSAEADRRMVDLERTVKAVTKNMGGLNTSIGEIVEMIIVPGIMEKMNTFKHNFTVSSPRKEFFYANGDTLTEVDLVLENCEAVMVVEVKTQFSLKWVKRHLTRLELLRKNEGITGMKGKTMFAAIAGMQVDSDARELAEENGMYIIGIEEDAERVRIEAPDCPKSW